MRLKCALFCLCGALWADAGPAPAWEIPNPALPASGQPNLITAPDGTVWMTWVEKDGPRRHALRFSARKDGRWTRPGLIASGENWFINWADIPSFLVLPDGSMAAHWLERNNSSRYSYGIRLARSFDGGKTWNLSYVPQVEHPDRYTGFVTLLGTPWGLRMAYLAPQPASAAPVPASKQDAGMAEMEKSSVLRLASFRPNGTVESDIELDKDVCTCCPTAAVMTPEGPLVAYRDHRPGEVRDISLVRWANGLWSAPLPAHRDNWKINACPVNGPALAAGGNTVALAWYTGAPPYPRVHLAFSQDAGKSFGRPVRLDGGRPAGRVGVLLLEDGSAVVSWLERATEGGEIRVRRVSRGGKPGAPLVVALAAAERSSGYPRLARGGGRLIVVWTADRVKTAVAPLPPLP